MSMTLGGCFFSAEEVKEDGRKIDESKEMMKYIKTRYSDNQYVNVKLVYHKDTKIVYMLFTESTYTNGITLFISENGNYMRYIDGKFMEITRDGELVVSEEQFTDEETVEVEEKESDEELDKEIEEIYIEAAKEIEKLYKEAENKE